MRNYKTKANRFPAQSAITSLFGKGPAPGLACMAVIIAAHISFVNNGFIWLDHGDIEDGRAVIPLSRWWVAFIKPFAATGFYRPLVTLVHSLDAGIWGLHAPGFHCTNIALHCLAALAAPLFIGCFLRLSRIERWGLVLVFGLHPLGMLPAGCISFRGESLMALFTFLSVWSYAKSRTSVKAPWLALLFLFSAGACFSKETAYFYLPSFICLFELTGFRRCEDGHALHDIPNVRMKSLWAALAMAAGMGIALSLRFYALQDLWRIAPKRMSWLEGLATRFAVIGRHLIDLISPVPPPISDAVAVVGIHPLPVLFAAAVCGAMAVLIRRGAINRDFTVSCIAMLLLLGISLVPALNVLPLIRFYSPHYAYLSVAPMAGAAILMARWTRRGGAIRTYGAYGICLLWCGAAAMSTTLAGARLKSDMALFSPEVKSDPRFLEGWFYIGNYYLAESFLDKAWEAYQAGLTSSPRTIAFVDRAEVLVNMGAVALQRNDLAAADSLLCCAQRILPPHEQSIIICNRAFIADRRGEWDTVITLLEGKEEILRRPEPCLVLAEALHYRGRERESLDMYQRSRMLEATGRYH
jgi:hypothetical protein